jgi:hypothetical protein
MWQKGLRLQESQWVFPFAEANQLCVVTGGRKHLFETVGEEGSVRNRVVVAGPNNRFSVPIMQLWKFLFRIWDFTR